MTLPAIFELASNSYMQLNGCRINNDLNEKKKQKMKETEELILTKNASSNNFWTTTTINSV